MTKYSKSAMLFTAIATVLYIIVVITNFLFPVIDSRRLNFNFFTIVIIMTWTIAILSCHGYIKRVVSSADGIISYDTVLPVLPITIIRLSELGWMLVRHRKVFRSKVFFIDIMLDLALIIILLLDKAHYYYEAREEGEDDD